LGFHKTPAVYGAFPTDPYSHTPKGQGARQPGMTGMVKEEILTRQAEVGLLIEDGCLKFNPLLLDQKELLTAPTIFDYLDVTGKPQSLALAAGSLAFTFCQVPVIIQLADRENITIHLTDGSVQTLTANRLDATPSRHIFQRDEVVRHLVVQVQGA
jgi:hypothetical protein